MSNSVLIIEDSKLVGNTLADRIRTATGFTPLLADSLAAAKEHLAGPASFRAIVLDLNLPDGSGDIILDMLANKSIPVVVFTGNITESTRRRIWAKGIADYVTKEGVGSVDYVVSIVRRLCRNPSVKVLVTEDSRSAREHLKQLLSTHKYHVLTAKNADEAIAHLEEHPDIRLMITDYAMPGRDGLELIRIARRIRPQDQLSIIVVSVHKDPGIASRCIKAGADDFIDKPFTSEQFYCRVTRSIDLLEYISDIREASMRDPLTGLHNRRYLFQEGNVLLQECIETNAPFSLALLDLDHFKSVNDSFGHDAGDTALKAVASLLHRRFPPPAVVSRYGGEEFCILLPHTPPATAHREMLQLLGEVEALCVPYGKECIELTLSIGLCTQKETTLDAIANKADEALYAAKDLGRNMVILADT